jgi:glucose/arabinose dehydrogenase
MKLMWRNVIGPVLGLLMILVLSACGQNNRNTSAPTPQRTRMPNVEAPGPPCQYIYWGPLHNDKITCVEIVYNHVTAPEAAPELSGLTFDPDNTLYMARTALGEIWAMRDQDGDGFMDDPYPVADGLRLPTALTFYDGALYVLSPDGVIRLDRSGGERFDQQTTLIEHLSGDTGLWPGSIGIGPDARLYVSLGASCDLCDPGDDIRPGMIVSYALDGTDRRVEATGLRDPADFAWNPETGGLWVVDSGRVQPVITTSGPPDELDQVTAGADFGFPYCYADRIPDPAFPDNKLCAATEPPRVTFPYQSAPGGMAFYAHDGFPFWQGDLVVALRGSWNLPEPAGYALIVVGFDGAEPDGQISRIAPDSRPTAIYAPYTLGKYSLSGLGFFPYHPADIAIDAQGWIYLSIAEGRIFRFRPRPAAG